MKKIIYIVGVLFALASCSKEEFTLQEPDGEDFTFNLAVEEPDYAPPTRVVMKAERYLLEMYEANLTATPVKMTSTDGQFNVTLKKGVDYVCLFWADGGATGYNATNLKAVTLEDRTISGPVAYCANVTVNSKTFNGSITLKCAVAELSFIDTDGLTNDGNTLKITYPYASVALNVADGTVTYTLGSTEETLYDIPQVEANKPFAAVCVLAPTVPQKLTGLKFQLNTGGVEKIIDETPVRANYRTILKGQFD